MKRQLSVALCAGALAALAVTASASSAAPARAQGRSPDAQGVWVVEDDTLSTTCLRAEGVPCPAGDIAVGFVHRIPLATAAAASRHYTPANPGDKGFDSFVEGELALFHSKHGRADQQPASGAALPPRYAPDAPLRTLPRGVLSRQRLFTLSTCTTPRQVHDHWQVTSAPIGATFDEDMYYGVTGACIEYADHHVQTYDSGHGIWKAANGNVYNGGGTELDTDGQQGCYGMDPNSAPFGGLSGGANVWGQSGLHTYVRVSSGSSCSWFDTYDVINFYWY